MRRLSRQSLAKEYDCSMRTIDRCIREIEELIGTRYPLNSVVRAPSVKLRADVARDYMENRAEIRNGTAPEFGGKGL